MGHGDSRLLIGAVCGISVALATALLLGQPHGSVALLSHELARHYWPHLRHLLARKNFATVMQAVGASIAFYGLGRAYIRAKYNLTVWQWAIRKVKLAWARLLRRPPEVAVRSGSAQGTIELHGHAVGLVTHHVDITLSLHEQIKQLAAYVNTKAQQAADMERKINEIQRELAQARRDTSALERKTLAHIETRIEKLDEKLNRIQVLDLTWAIRGLLISAVGTVLSFGT